MSSKTKLKQRNRWAKRLHLLGLLFWVASVYPTWTRWQEWVAWAAFAGVYGNIVTHLTGWQTADTAEQVE